MKIFTTSSGVEVQVKSISPFLVDKVTRASAAKYPKAPVYRFEDVTGEIQELPHDEDSIKSEGTTDEERRAWETYKADYARAEAEASERLLNLLLFYGIGDVEERTGWEEAQAEFGIEVPSSPVARKVHYLTTELVPDPSDLAKLGQLIMGTRGEEEEAAEAASAAFQHPVG